jgi:hypothetical protein
MIVTKASFRNTVFIVFIVSLIFGGQLPSNTAEAATTNIAKTLAGSGDDVFFVVRQLDDGNYVTLGYSDSTDGDFVGYSGDHFYPLFFAKYDQNGKLLVHKQISKINMVTAIQPTSDNGFILAGFYIDEDTYKITKKAMKFNAAGKVEWETDTKTNPSSFISNMHQLADGYIFTGATMYTYGTADYKKNGLSDGFVEKYDLKGKLLWKKKFGGSGQDRINASVIRNNQLIVSGTFDSIDGDLVGHKKGDCDIIKFDLTGKVIQTYAVDSAITSGAITLSPNNELYMIDSKGIYKLNESFKKVWSYKLTADALVVDINKDNEILINSMRITTGTQTVMKLDHQGKVAWTKKYTANSASSVADISFTSTGGYVTVGGKLTGRISNRNAQLIIYASDNTVSQ